MCSNIVDDVTDSVVTGDFSNLASNIRNQTNNFLGGGGHNGYAGQPDDGVYVPNGQAGSQAGGQQNGGAYTSSQYDGGPAWQNAPPRPDGDYNYYTWSNETFSQGKYTRQTVQYTQADGRGRNAHITRAERRNIRNQITPFTSMRPRRGSGAGLSSVGGIGLFFFGMALIGFIIDLDIGGIIFSGIVTALSIFALGKGVISRRLLNRFYRYAGIVGRREYVDIHEVALQTADSDSGVVKNLNNMMEKNMLPPMAVYDDQHTTLLLTENARSQYQAAKRARETREREAAARENQSASDSQSAQVMEEGRKFIEEIRDTKNNITDAGMKQRLDRLEQVVDRIFDQIESHPETSADMRKFMNYYIPTTNKLLDAYEDLDKQPAGDNVSKTRKEIEDAVDALISAYEKMFDKMFENVAWDISSDISVMKSMLEQDGLSDDEVLDSQETEPVLKQ